MTRSEHMIPQVYKFLTTCKHPYDNVTSVGSDELIAMRQKDNRRIHVQTFWDLDEIKEIISNLKDTGEFTHYYFASRSEKAFILSQWCTENKIPVGVITVSFFSSCKVIKNAFAFKEKQDEI